jgi:hypothetical protein
MLLGFVSTDSADTACFPLPNQMDDDLTFAYRELDNSKPVQRESMCPWARIFESVESGGPKSVLLQAVPLKKRAGWGSTRPDSNDVWTENGLMPTKVTRRLDISLCSGAKTDEVMDDVYIYIDEDRRAGLIRETKSSCSAR